MYLRKNFSAEKILQKKLLSIELGVFSADVIKDLNLRTFITANKTRLRKKRKQL